ncbi:flagellar brake protein [Castellaniella sp.]|uniref:flagellar brake protein n=1 Tax=Castellaniella sp. TaxID=1955812 RepID=UPI002AFF092D|nr:flagellar brake protein [Castellaniella sp.]
MAFEEDDPYSVSQRLDIQNILQGLLNKRALVRLDIPGHAVSVISTLLDVDVKQGTLILDNATEDHLNTQLLRAPAIRLQGMLDRVMIECSGKISPTMHDGRPAFSMLWPDQLRRMQRREFFRMDVPASNPATCSIEHPSLPSGKATLPLANISAGGLQLIDRAELLADHAIGTFFDDCTLNLPDTGALDVGMRLLRLTRLTQDGDKPLLTVACRFFNLPANREIAIQQYVGSLERAVLARRWGSE